MDYPVSRLSDFPKWQSIERLLCEPQITGRTQRQGSFAGKDKIIGTEHISDMSQKISCIN